MTRSRFSILRELIRRRVLRAAGGYIVVSWVLVQVASIVLPEFNAPNWSMRALIILLTVGFPLAILLAWTIDITASGLRRTPDSHFSRTKENMLQFGVVGVATVMSAAVLWWVWTGYIEPETERQTRSNIKSNPVIAVNAPRKMVGPEEIDWLGEGVANLLRDELAESSHVIMLTQARWNEISSSAESTDAMHAVARRHDVDYLIEGNYQPSRNGLVLTARIEDIENETQIYGGRIEQTDAAGIIAATSEIAVGIMRALEIPSKKNVERFTADFAVKNMDAYEAYIAGLAFLANFDYQLAEESFNAALAVAPDYHMARYRLAMVYQSTGRSEAALHELNRIPDDADLTQREQLYVEGAKASFTAEQDPARSIEIYAQLVGMFPYDMEAGQHLGNAYWLDYQEDAAIDEFRRLAELHSYDPSAWMALGERLLDVGEYDEASTALRKYVEMSPQDHFGVALLGNLSQLRGEFADSIEYYEESLLLKPGFAVATLGLARSRYKLGEKEAAERLLRQLIRDTDQAAGYRIDAAFDLAGVLRGQGRFHASANAIDDIAEIVRQEGPRTAMMLSTMGLAALEQGDSTSAATLIEQAIAESPGPPTRYLFARGLLELRLGRYDQLRNTVAAIQALALPSDDPDRTEDKAASYLLGMAALEQDALDTARSELTAAVDKAGYEYALYSLGLAKLYLAADEPETAAVVAERAMTHSDPGDLRLDLELDRARALLLHAEALARMGSITEARRLSERFVSDWHAASDDSPDLQRARLLTLEK